MKVEGEEGFEDTESGESSITTNIYVGNLNPTTTEENLYRLFSQHGVVASVKIMWPFKEEERARNRNCGFVAFMNREDAEKAFRDLQNHRINDYELNLGWGKSVILPLRPFIPPPQWGLPQQNYPIPPSALQVLLSFPSPSSSYYHRYHHSCYHLSPIS